MCKNSFSVRAFQFMMRYPLFSVGHFEIKYNPKIPQITDCIAYDVYGAMFCGQLLRLWL